MNGKSWQTERFLVFPYFLHKLYHKKGCSFVFPWFSHGFYTVSGLWRRIYTILTDIMLTAYNLTHWSLSETLCFRVTNVFQRFFVLPWLCPLLGQPLRHAWTVWEGWWECLGSDAWVVKIQTACTARELEAPRPRIPRTLNDRGLLSPSTI